MSHGDGDFIALQSVLAGEYSLDRELGRGGMGVVYLAREVRLARPVAIKVLPRSSRMFSADTSRWTMRALWA
jgi:serine/threonine protein kinase